MKVEIVTPVGVKFSGDAGGVSDILKKLEGK